MWAKSATSDGTFTAISNATASTYTPAAGDVGNYLLATASYTDGEDSGKSASAVTTSEVAANVPAKPAAPTATAASSSSLTVPWTAPDSRGSEITDYDVQYRSGTSGTWADAKHSGTATPMTITGLTASTSYQVQVRAGNVKGAGDWSESATATTDNNAPDISGGSTFTLYKEENTSGLIYDFTATDAGDHTITWSLGGTDASYFTIVSSNGRLTVGSGTTLNFEAKSSYNFNVIASDGKGGTASVAITLNVRDVDENPGKPAAPTVTAASTTSLTVI